MRKRILLAVACTLLCMTVCFGQPAWKFRSDNYAGLAAGELGSYGHVQTVNGLYKGPWFLGLGAALDYYRFRSIPLFLSVTRDLPAFTKGGGLFVHLDGGIDLPWYKRPFVPYERFSSTFHSGSYWSAGLGYKWRLSDHTDKALLLSAGYNMKKLKEDQPTQWGCLNPGICTVNTQTYVYEYLNRTFLFAVGFRF